MEHPHEPKIKICRLCKSSTCASALQAVILSGILLDVDGLVWDLLPTILTIAFVWEDVAHTETISVTYPCVNLES